MNPIIHLLIFTVSWILLIVGALAGVNYWSSPKDSGVLAGPPKFLYEAMHDGGIDSSGRCELRVTDGVTTIRVWHSIFPPIRQHQSTVIFVGVVVPPYMAASEKRILAVRWPGPVKDITLEVAKAAAEARRAANEVGGNMEYFQIFSGVSGIEQSVDNKDQWIVKFWMSYVPNHEVGIATFGPKEVDRWIDESTITLSSYKDFRPLQPLTAGNINK